MVMDEVVRFPRRTAISGGKWRFVGHGGAPFAGRRLRSPAFKPFGLELKFSIEKLLPLTFLFGMSRCRNLVASPYVPARLFKAQPQRRFLRSEIKMHVSIPHHFNQIPLPPPATKLVPFTPATATATSISYPHRRLASTTATVTSTTILKPPSTEPISTPLPTDSIATSFWDYQMLFLSQRSETLHPIPLPISDGSIPSDFPVGTYYLAGPGIFSDDHGSTIHPLDGHGYLRAFEFRDAGAVRYSARYVETDAKKEEREEETGEWRFTHRGPFSMLKGGKRVGNTKVMKNVANTAVVRWGGKLLCLWEGGQPYQIDGRTLQTISPIALIPDGDQVGCRRWPKLPEVGFDLAAALLRPVLHGVFKMPQKRLLSHYKIDEKLNRLLILSCNAEDMLLPRSNFTFYEFDSNYELKQKKEFTICDHLMIHDWAFTDNHYILIGNRIKLDLQGSMLAVSGLSPMISALSVNPSQSKTPIYLLPRSGSSVQKLRDWKVPIEAPSQLWISHVANAFEENDDEDSGGGVRIRVHASACSYQWFNFQKMFGYNWRNRRLDPSFMNKSKGNETLLPHLVKISIHLDASGECRSCTIANSSSKWSWPADFPAINGAFAGQRNKFMYAGTASGTRRFLPHFPFDSVVKINCFDGTVSSWCAGRRMFIGEPIFIPKVGAVEEDDGYILTVEYAVSKLRCYLVILDAKRIGRANALVARLDVPKHLYFPLGFHGFWDDFTHI
ncbi:carotenoid cleavage dioxygenase 7, chloroplastic [Phalaenopsis equestris]|uniref:carotenoid cleavage dioxygenase 7, chloroplastic n=1 Tax=Phalaenopsis equestris TaxID=78828 RepID=UPI0009E3E5CD|nr:carotenoid cleavage dioxygenase 7, chloroplastic [Phalaenopsis equestris]